MIVAKSSSKAKGTMRRLGLLASLAALCAAAFGMNAAPASAAAEWDSREFWAPSPPIEGKPGVVDVDVINKGDTQTNGEAADVTVEFPPGLTFKGLTNSVLPPWEVSDCTGIGTPIATCKRLGVSRAFSRLEHGIPFGFDVAPGTIGTFPYKVTISGAGATPHVKEGTITVGSELYPPGLTPGTLIGGAYDALGNDFTRAGGHPYEASVEFRINRGLLGTQTGGKVKDIVTELPAGFLGDPTAYPQCKEEDFQKFPPACPSDTHIGVSRIYGTTANTGRIHSSGVWNLEPPPGYPAAFAFKLEANYIKLLFSVRSDGDYGVRITVPNTVESTELYHTKLAIWGVPGDPSHDKLRCLEPNMIAEACVGYAESGHDKASNGLPKAPYSGPVNAFLSNPTQCSKAPETIIRSSRWANPPAPDYSPSDPAWSIDTIKHPMHTDCATVPFDPTIDFETTSKAADSSTGLDVHLHIPREGDLDPNGQSQSHLKKTIVKLPEGLAFNASAANGISACSPAQIGQVSSPGETARFNNAPVACPDASKIANAQVISPALDHPLVGEVYLAEQDTNPFGSTFAIFLTVEDPGIRVKLAGQIELNQQTGQITTTFDNNPQLPFSDLTLNFDPGPRASLATPQTCGTFTTETQFEPWSGTAAVVNNDPFTIDQGAKGQGCVSSKSQLPLNAGLNAGSRQALAGAKSPFDIQITRPDGSQELEKMEISPPPGFVASLKGIPYCSEAQIAATAARDSGKAELASSTCPPASQVGTTNVGAGAGDHPLYTPGKLYLAGPYKGETLSVVAVTPAVAGPFDLGNVVVRSALKINPLTARITAVTDSLPKTLEGVPLRIKDIRIALDRPDWAMNPTNCEAMSVDVTAYGTEGAVSKPSNRYQVGSCDRLGFKPRLSIHLKGGTKRGDHPALVAKLKTRPGDANIARAAVTLPSSAFLDQAHIRTICTRVQYAADTCPKGAIYGYAKAETPLLDDPIQGNVILRSSNNKLPDLVGRLRGVANIEAVGRIDSVKGGIRNTFEVIPDAPFDVFTLRMQGGKKGLVINSKNLCATTNRATVKFTAQNGRRYNYRPKVIADGCGKARKKGKRGKGAQPKEGRR